MSGSSNTGVMFGRMTCVTMAAVGAFVAAGAYPTWALAGPAGIAAELAAACVASFWSIGVGMAALHTGKRGPAALVMAFILAGLAGGVGAAVAAVVGSRIFGAPLEALVIWTGAFYWLGLVVEGIWLGRQLILGRWDRLHHRGNVRVGPMEWS